MNTGTLNRRSLIIFGVIFGAWLGGVYALASQAVNWIALPGIPLTPPENDLQQYILNYILVGALLGLVTSLPRVTISGVVLGGGLGAFAITLTSLKNVWGTDTLGQALIFLFYTFLPLGILLMPLAYLVRRGADAQNVDPERPYLWARRIIVPLGLTLLVVLMGAFSLYSADIRNAFRITQQLITDSRTADSTDTLPESFQRVQGYLENTSGPYTLGWSDKVETFMGPVPATGELSQFLIIATYDNGFSFACVFSRTTTVPNCTNY